MFYPSSDERFTANSFEEVRPLLLRSMFWRPSYLAMSAWLDHIPFAFWLIEAHRPRTLVELGTHYGASYFAFCQAVDRLGLDTSCYAVDTWKGDEHAGFYGEDVAQAVRAHNDANYSGFSRLVRSTFDEALEHFSDGTIDLLHIDGLHTAEAVAHDFESWRPKLSDEAVVLFHDTNVRERGFGVFKFFERIREEHPAFEFIHGHGLGVLGVGRRQKPLLRRLFDASRDIASRQAIREIFGRLGRNCSIAHAARHDGKRKKSIEAELAKMRSSLASAKSALEAREAKAAEQAQAFEAERARLLARVADLEGGESKEAEGRSVKMTELERELAAKAQEIETLKGALAERAKESESAASAALTRALEAEAQAERYREEIARLEERVAEHSRELTTATRLLQDKTAEAEKSEGLVSAALARAAEAESRAKEQAEAVARLEASVAERFRELATVSSLLQVRTAEATKHETAVSEALARAAETETRVKQQAEAIKRLETSLAERYQELAAVSRLLDEKTAESKHHENAASAALARAAEAEARAKQQTEEIARLETTMAERFREIATLSRLLSDKEKDADLADSSAKGLAERLTTLQDSTVWKAAAQVNRVISPLGGGRRQLRRQRRLVEASGLFDRDWYLKENPDVAANGADPLDHFLLFGGQEGRAPSRSFDSGAYLRANTDVAEAGVNPLVHYLIHGRSEGRQVAAVR